MGELAKELLRQLDAELALDLQERSTRAADETLKWVIERIVSAQNLLDAGHPAHAALALDEVVRRAIDEWPLQAPLTEAVTAFAQELRHREG